MAASSVKRREWLTGLTLADSWLSVGRSHRPAHWLGAQGQRSHRDKIGWTADPAVVQGTEFMEQGKFDEAIAVLQKHVAAKPDALGAHSLLHQWHWRKNDLPAHLAVTA